MNVEVPRVDNQKLISDRLGEASAAIQQRVDNARKIQRDRFAESPSHACNTDIRITKVRKFCTLDETS
jgi:magnesium chelatase family protein